MNNFNPNPQRGFTLIELLVALVLTIFMAGGAMMLHLSGRQAAIDTEALSRMQENIRFASDYVVRDIRNAGYRDEAFLRWGHEQQIREAYATILNAGTAANSGDTLRVRYAGRGHCTQAFNEYRLVENEYSISNGALICRGRSISQSAAGTVAIADDTIWDGTGIELVQGVNSVQFDALSVAGGTCTFDLTAWEADNTINLCTGVTITLLMEGMQDMNTPGTTNLRRAQLTAAFRNVILDIVNENAFATTVATGAGT